MTTEETLPAVVHRAARLFGDLEAVVDGSDRPTFAQVESLVERRARALVASGVAPGDRVSIWAPNGLEWILLSFAVYAAGAVLVPINTRFKGDEAAYILRQAGVRLLLTVTDFLDTDYVALLDGHDVGDLRDVVVVSGPVPAGATSGADFLAGAETVRPEAVAEREAALTGGGVSDVIFTSGTTGKPKGARLTHGASIATYSQWADRVGLRAGDRELIVYPFFHTSGLKSGVLAAFLKGATLVPHAVFDVPSVLRMVADEKITFLPGPPSVFQSILSHPDVDRFDIGSLRLSVTGAATVPVELVQRMRTELRLESVVTAYGLTETHGTATVCYGDDPTQTIAETVGAPLDGLELRVVDDHGADVPAGDVGEVWVRGFNVTEGYFGDPDATADAVVDGWLRTGDIGWLGPDGHLRLVDRKKDLLMVGGFNVAPAEVERVLLRRDDIAQVAVVAAPDARLGEVGAAFVVPRPGRTVDPDEVVGWCRQQMANYKVPRYVVPVDALPVNASGKVQKVALREQARGLTG
ncbi:MAG TPA: AMP-binding protein [Acidimicrobiales bacterium]|nr:AMP-binding protein [Acidimicrobiales bacterium]